MKTDTDNTPFCPCPSENLDNLRERTDRTHSLRVSVSGREKSRVLGSPRATPVAPATVHRARAKTTAAPAAPAAAVQERLGADGKTYKLPTRIEKSMVKHGWYQRAELAAQEARYAPLDTCPRDPKMRKAAQAAVDAL